MGATEARSCRVVKEFTGHFIGRELHMEPFVHHLALSKLGTEYYKQNVILQPGMAFTIEPAIAEGMPFIKPAFDDGWTFVTEDGGLSAQFEHTVVVREGGLPPEILTLSETIDGNFYE